MQTKHDQRDDSGVLASWQIAVLVAPYAQQEALREGAGERTWCSLWMNAEAMMFAPSAAALVLAVVLLATALGTTSPAQANHSGLIDTDARLSGHTTVAYLWISIAYYTLASAIFLVIGCWTKSKKESSNTNAEEAPSTRSPKGQSRALVDVEVAGVPSAVAKKERAAVEPEVVGSTLASASVEEKSTFLELLELFILRERGYHHFQRLYIAGQFTDAYYHTEGTGGRGVGPTHNGPSTAAHTDDTPRHFGYPWRGTKHEVPEHSEPRLVALREIGELATARRVDTYSMCLLGIACATHASINLAFYYYSTTPGPNATAYLGAALGLATTLVVSACFVPLGRVVGTDARHRDCRAWRLVQASNLALEATSAWVQMRHGYDDGVDDDDGNCLERYEVGPLHECLGDMRHYPRILAGYWLISVSVVLCGVNAPGNDLTEPSGRRWINLGIVWLCGVPLILAQNHAGNVLGASVKSTRERWDRLAAVASQSTPGLAKKGSLEEALLERAITQSQKHGKRFKLYALALCALVVCVWPIVVTAALGAFVIIKGNLSETLVEKVGITSFALVLWGSWLLMRGPKVLRRTALKRGRHVRPLEFSGNFGFPGLTYLFAPPYYDPRNLQIAMEMWPLMLTSCAWVTAIFNPQYTARNPLKDIVGYNNLCVWVDSLPARYVAFAFIAVQVLFSWRHVYGIIRVYGKLKRIANARGECAQCREIECAQCRLKCTQGAHANAKILDCFVQYDTIRSAHFRGYRCMYPCWS